MPPDRQWLKAVYEQAADSVVLIETELGAGSGFFFYSPRYVATALHVVDDADTILVAAHDGRRWLAKVAAYSEDYDVALLDLGEEVPGARVLAPFRGTIAIGENVAVIGHPFTGLEETLPQLRGLLNWSLTRGVVGAVAGSWLQTDAAINPGNSGGPVLNERGEVLGVVSAKLTNAQGIGMIARIQRVEALVPEMGQKPPPRRTFQFDGLELGLAVHWAKVATLDGFDLGLGLRLLKHYPINLRVGFLGGEAKPSEPTIVSSRLERFDIELTAGYYVPLLSSVALTPYAGAGFFFDRTYNSSLRIDQLDTCTSPPCLVSGKVLRSTDRDFRVLPMLGATLDIGRIRLSYAYQFDLSDFDGSQHRALFALNF